MKPPENWNLVCEALKESFPGWLDFWKEIVSIESPFSDRDAVNEVGAAVRRECEKLGLYTRVYPSREHGDAVIACTCPFPDYHNGVVLSAHLDTVFVQKGQFSPTVRMDDRYLYGPGVCDCKGGAVACLAVVQALQAADFKTRPIKLIFVSDEECGRSQEENVFYKELPGSVAMFNLEPNGLDGGANSVVVARKASIGAVFEIHGAAGHVGRLSSAPPSAIRQAAHIILALESLSDYDHITFSTGEISGGTIFTSVPAYCRLKVNCRMKCESDVPHVMEILSQTAQDIRVPGTSVSFYTTGYIHPMEPNERNLWLFGEYNKAGQALGHAPREPFSSGGGSDAVFASELSIPVIDSVGPSGSGAHTTQEKADLTSFIPCCERLALTILSLKPKDA